MSSNHRITERVLELLGAGGNVLLFGWFAGEGSLMSILSKNNNGGNSGGGSGSGSTAQLAYAQSSGSWLPVQSEYIYCCNSYCPYSYR